MFIVNKSKCMECGVCVKNCPGGIRIGKDGKAEIIDQQKVAKCGGVKICPFGSIKEVSDNYANENKGEDNLNGQWTLEGEDNFNERPRGGRGMGYGRGLGRGWGRKLGRGLGRGLGRRFRREFRERFGG